MTSSLTPIALAQAHSHPSEAIAVLIAVFVTLVAVALVIGSLVLGRWEPPDDDDGPGGGGGGGGRPPDPPPRPSEPLWWPEFEREFAAYAARSHVHAGGAATSASRRR